VLSQLNIYLLSFGALQGFLIGITFLKKPKRSLVNTYFVLILTVLSLQLTFKLISKIWLMHHFHLPYLMSYSLPFLIGPLLYLYVNARASIGFNKRDLLHSVPFLASIMAILLLEYRIVRLHYFGFPGYNQAALQLLSLTTYCWLAYKTARKNIGDSGKLLFFICSLGTIEFVLIIALALMYIYYGRYPDIRLLFVGLTLLIYWITYKQLSNPDFFLGIQKNIVALQFHNHVKYSNSGLRQEEAEKISHLLEDAMKVKKLFLESELTIDTLSKELGISRHHVSQVLNEKFNKSYFDFVNHFRLEEVKFRLIDPKFRNYTIAAIALDSGFSSVSSFNDLFKKNVGIPPSKFRESVLRQMHA
jgi:AraC-like DNA-binding protein